jgi:hypothetical protein
MSREDYAQQHGAATADFDAVKAFATVHGLTVTEGKRWRSCSSNSIPPLTSPLSIPPPLPWLGFLSEARINASR